MLLKRFNKFGFTLAEMLIVLLIISLVTAALIPIVTKKTIATTSSSGGGGGQGVAGIWQYASNNSDVFYGTITASQKTMIGVNSSSSNDITRLIINTPDATYSHMLFKENGSTVGNLAVTNTGLVRLGKITESSGYTGEKSTLVGSAITSNYYNNTQVGYGSSISGIGFSSFGYGNSTSVGAPIIGLLAGSGRFGCAMGGTVNGGVVLNTQGNAIGCGSSANWDNIAIGGVDGTNLAAVLANPSAYPTEPSCYTRALSDLSGDFNTALGVGAVAGDTASSYITYALAIGAKAQAKASYALGLGYNARALYVGTTIVGYCPDSSGTLGPYSTFLGTTPVLFNNNRHCTIIGYNNSLSVSDGDYNTIIGVDSNPYSSNPTGFHNYIKMGVNNTCIGYPGTNGGANGWYAGNSVCIGNATNANGGVAIGLGANATKSNVNINCYANTTPGTNSTAVCGNASGDNSCRFGRDDTAVYTGALGKYSCAFGYNATASTDYSIALGYNASASATSVSIAVGNYAVSSGQYSVALGGYYYNGSTNYGASATGNYSTAVGSYARANSDYATAVGYNAAAVASKSTAIGSGAVANTANTIVFGRAADSVKIPGTLWVVGVQIITNSDRRLKNIKGSFKDGLEKIRQINTYNYALKADKKKNPNVGVIAQELQKVFPNAISKNSEGYLGIRQDDMFYAMLNSIKQLDNILQNLANDLKIIVSKVQTIDNIIAKNINVNTANSQRISAMEKKNALISIEDKKMKEHIAKYEK